MLNIEVPMEEQKPRKPWKKKSPLEVVQGQRDKVVKEIETLRESLETKIKELGKLDQAIELLQ